MDDYPLKELPTDIPAWTENFCLAGYDPGAGIDIYLHLGRWRKDIRLWRELMAIRLPDNTVIAHRAIGNVRARKQSPGGPQLRCEIVEPGRHLQWSFLGGSRRVPSLSLRDHLLCDGPLVRTQFSFDYLSELPIWDIDQAGHASDMAGHGHVEQIGRAQAKIQVGDETFHFDSMVNRDHSRGPRILGRLYGHLWMQGILADGTCFHAYDAQEGAADNTVMSEACVIVGSLMHSARLEVGYRLPPQRAIDHIDVPVPFALGWAGGCLSGRIERFDSAIFCQFTSPSDSYIGAHQIDGEENSRYIQQPMRFRLDDGREGYGHIERTVPGKTIADPL